MINERLGAQYSMYDGPQGGVLNGIIYALPVTAALWVAIAGIVYLIL
jgi:hypothetical protein